MLNISYDRFIEESIVYVMNECVSYFGRAMKRVTTSDSSSVIMHEVISYVSREVVVG